MVLVWYGIDVGSGTTVEDGGDVTRCLTEEIGSIQVDVYVFIRRVGDSVARLTLHLRAGELLRSEDWFPFLVVLDIRIWRAR